MRAEKWKWHQPAHNDIKRLGKGGGDEATEGAKPPAPHPLATPGERHPLRPRCLCVAAQHKESTKIFSEQTSRKTDQSIQSICTVMDVRLAMRLIQENELLRAAAIAAAAIAAAAAAAALASASAPKFRLIPP